MGGLTGAFGSFMGASGLGSALGGVLGGPVGGFLGGLAGSAFDNYSASSAATKAFDRDVYMMSHKYQMQVADLKAAGLNPALAYGATPQALSAPMAQTSKGQTVQGVQALASAQQARAATENLTADAELKRAQAETERNRPENVAANTGLTVASAGEVRAKTDVLVAELPKIQEEIRNLKADIAKKGAETATIDALREITVKLKRLEAQGASLLLPEKGARGAAGKKVIAGLEGIDKYGPSVAGFVADQISEAKWELDQMRRKLWDVVPKLKRDRDRRGREFVKKYGGRSGASGEW